MKKLAIIIGVLFVFQLDLKAQDVSQNLEKAVTAYTSESALEARDNLQDALIEVNNIMGKLILAAYPSSVVGLSYEGKEDVIIGGAGFAEIFVERTYSSENKSIKLTMANDSPMLAVVNAFLGNKMLTAMLGSQTGQKEVKISGYRGMMEAHDNADGPEGHTVNIPIGDSLFIIEASGFTEAETLEIANQSNIESIAQAIK